MVDGTWVFHADTAVLHTIVPSCGGAVAATALGQHRPEMGISDRDAEQQELGESHQIC